MNPNDTLGKLEVEEEQIIEALAAIVQGAKTIDDLEMVNATFMTLGILYRYDPEEFFIRLGNTVVKDATSRGKGNDVFIGLLKKEIDQKTKESKKVKDSKLDRKVYTDQDLIDLL